MSKHPAPEQLLDFSLGKLDEHQSSSIEDHLAECSPCCLTLANFADDTFAELVRQAGVSESSGDTTMHTASTADVAIASLPNELKEHVRYLVKELIGRGGMGDVYRAEHRLMNRSVAIKIISPAVVRHPQAAERFHREVQAAAQLSHPNIVAAYDAEVSGECHFLVMEYVDGRDLAKVVKQDGTLPVKTACDYVCQVARGLQHASSKGMIHRDIKPNNIILASDGTVRILDFGLAAFASRAERSTLTETRGGLAEDPGPLTRDGNIIGTPDFLSPEQAQGAARIDGRSDIYSLGCTLFFLLTGQVPFPGASIAAKLNSHIEQPLPDICKLRADVPEELAAAISKMTAKQVGQRYQEPDEIVVALKRIVEVPNSPATVSLPQSARSMLSSLFSRVHLGVLLMTFLVVAAALTLFLSPGDAPSDQEIAKLKTAYQQADKDEHPEAGFALAKALFDRWATTSADNPLAESRLKELQTVENAVAGAPLTESSARAKQFWAKTVEPVLLAGKIDQAKAKIIAKLVEPNPAQRMTDAIAKRGDSAEPYGWDVQAVYSLALARAGDFDAARRENDLVIKKIRNNLAKPDQADFQVDYLGAQRTNKSLLRELNLERALIEALAGDNAAVQKFSAEAGKIGTGKEGPTKRQQQLLAAIAEAIDGSAQHK